MGSSSKGATTNVSNNSPPPEVMQEYENIINRANVVGSQPYQQYGGQMVAPMSQEQLSGIAGINNAQGIAQPYFNQAQDYLSLGAAPTSAYDINRFQNPYQQQVVQATLANLGQLNQEQQTGLEGNLMGQGGLFNDRLGVAQAQLAKQQATAEAPTIAGLNASGYSQALTAAQAEKNRQLGAASSEAGLGTANLADILQGFQAQYGAGTAEQQLAQQYLNVPYQQFQQQQAYPYQQLSWLAGIGTGVGSNMGGQSTSTTTPPKPWYQFWNRGGGIKRPGYDEGGGLGGYPYAGASSYIPGISITHGSGPPKPAAGHQQKGQDPFGDIMKMGQSPMGKGLGKMFNPSTQGGIPDLMGTGEPGLDEVTQAGAESGMSAGELGFTAGGTDLLASGAGDAAVAGGGEAAAGAGAAMGGMDLSALFALFALKDGGGINVPPGMRRGGGIHGLHRLHRAGGGGDFIPSRDDPQDYSDFPDDIPTSSTPPPDAPTGAGLAPMAAAPLSSPTGLARPSWAGAVGAPEAVPQAGPNRPVRNWEETASGAPGGIAGDWTPNAASSRTPTYPGMAGQVADQWREAGAKENAVKGVLYNVNAESEFRSELRHPDQPRFTGEAHYAHGMYQHGGNQWTGLDRYAQQNGLDWRDPKTQTAYEIENLRRTNPDVWRRMNEAPTWQEAAKVYARWLAPKKEYLDQREANIDRSSDPLHGYTGASTAGSAGDDRLPARATPTSGGVTLRSTSDGEGNGETRTTPGSGGIGRLFTADNALRFGLAMLANPTPYIGNAIGQAGLATLGASAEQERYGAKQLQEDRKFKLDARFKQAQIDKIDKGFELQGQRLDLANSQAAERAAHFQDQREYQQERERLAREKSDREQKRASDLEEKRQKDEKFGVLSPGFRWKINPDTGVPDPSRGQEAIPGGKESAEQAGNKAAAIAQAKSEATRSQTGLDDNQVEQMAAMYNIVGPQALTNVGRGTQGSAALMAIHKAAARQRVENGVTPQQQADAWNRFKGDAAAQRTLSTSESKMGMAGFEAKGAIALAEPIIKKMESTRTNILPLNKLIELYQKGTQSEDQYELMTRLQGIENTYAAVMSRGSNVVTDSARNRAHELLNSATSPNVMRRVIETMNSEIDMAINSPEKMREFYRKNHGEASLEPVPLGGGAGGGGGGGGAGTETPPVANARKAPDGKWYVSDPERPGKYLQVQ